MIIIRPKAFENFESEEFKRAQPPWKMTPSFAV